MINQIGYRYMWMNVEILIVNTNNTPGHIRRLLGPLAKMGV